MISGLANTRTDTQPDKTLRVLVVDIVASTPTFVYSHVKIISGDVILVNDMKDWLSRHRDSAWARLTLPLWRMAYSLRRRTRNDLSPYDRLLARWIQKERFDVVFAEFGPAAAAMLSVCKKAGVPLVPCFHGYDITKRKVVEQHQEVYRQLFAYATSVISVSHFLSCRLIKAGCPPEKLVYSPCLPEESFYEIQGQSDRPLLLFCGRFVYKKCPQALLLAFARICKQHPEAQLIMAGSGELLYYTMQLCRFLGTDRQVAFPGRITQEKFRELLMHARAYVQHSITAHDGDSEGSPVAIMEAQAAGVPVISTRHSDIPTIVIHNKTGFLVEEGDIEGMARHMSFVLENPDAARQMGRLAKEHMLRKYPKRSEADIINDTLHQAVQAYRHNRH